MELPGFELIDKIGEGGMATVWKARQLSLNRIVAIKVLSAQMARETTDVQRFLSEAQAMAALKHPGIIQVYDANLHEGFYYFIMEYIAGYSVGAWLRRKKILPESDAILVAQHVAEALHYAWSTQKLIHCDIKPDNIMIDVDGTIKVADLGLARSISAVGGDKNSDEVMGTPNYMAPEQATGVPDLDCRTDIYALGAMLYQMVTGKMLFEESSDEVAMQKQLNDFVPDPADINPKLSASTCWLLEKMLVKDRTHRHSDWKAVLADLQRVSRGTMILPPEPADNASTIKRSEKRVRPRSKFSTSDSANKNAKSRKPATIAAFIAIAAILGGAILFIANKYTHGKLPVSTHPPSATPTTTHQPQNQADLLAQKQFDEAMTWAEAHPEDYDQIAGRYDRIAAETRGTKWSRMAAAEAQTARNNKGLAIQKVLLDLKKRVDGLLSNRKFKEASGLMSDYSGIYAAETLQARRQQLVLIQNQETEFKASAEVDTRKIDEKSALVLDWVAERLINENLRSAMEYLSRSLSSDISLGTREDLNDISSMLANADALDQRILDSFRNQTGTSVAILTREGVKSVKITGVENDRIRAEESVTKGNYSTSRPVDIMLSDLATAELVRRLGGGDDRETMLRKGLFATQSKAYSQARVYFMKLPPCLAGPLTKRLDAIAAKPM